MTKIKPISKQTAAQQKKAPSSGGVTGSRPVKIEGETYQEKGSLRDKSFFNTRNLKAKHSDRENLGEAVAACYVQAYLGTTHAAHVETYYDPSRKRVEVISKYLKNTRHTIDQYYTDPNALNRKLTKRKHVLSVLTDEVPADTPDAETPDNEWHMASSSMLAKTLAKTLAAAAIIGDHDVNPGNRMVLTQGNQALEVASIDFGHAFNDLIHAPSVVGGRVQQREHPIFDFFNRARVAGARPGGDVSKFWRDFKGFVPSKLLGEALIELGEKQEAQVQGLKDAREEFEALFEMIKANPEDTTSKAYVVKSFNEIHQAITGQYMPQRQTEDEKIETFFDAIDSFIQTNANNAVLAGQMMILQVEFTEALHQDVPNIFTLSDTWKEKFQAAKLMDANGELVCPWFKRSLTEPAFQGTFEDFLIQEREKYLKNQEIQEMGKASPAPSVLQGILRQMHELFEYIHAYYEKILSTTGAEYLRRSQPEVDSSAAPDEAPTKDPTSSFQ